MITTPSGSQKRDAADDRFVELKSQDQLDTQALHRSRDRLVSERAALINPAARAVLLECDVVAPQSNRQLEQFLAVPMDERAARN